MRIGGEPAPLRHAHRPGRGDRLDETLDLLGTIWADEVVTHTGRHFTVPASRIGPKPVQRPRPPILPAGFDPRALRRVARRADGWLAVGLPLPHLAGMWATIRRQAGEYGRDPGDLRMVQRLNPRLTDTPADPARVPAYGTLHQIADYARAARADEVFIDLTLTVRTADEMLDLAGGFLAAIQAG
ncbi:LLM class flavin-dependent oxidoreductase [Actinoplanes sp. NPDC049599]|uniref:LLM class flavin-dependent oxidoreductase n=1 Tax=Actinoplanes sp. NPDC049599 TaxID=3363903 RepID=UPI00378F372B